VNLHAGRKLRAKKKEVKAAKRRLQYLSGEKGKERGKKKKNHWSMEEKEENKED